MGLPLTRPDHLRFLCPQAVDDPRLVRLIRLWDRAEDALWKVRRGGPRPGKEIAVAVKDVRRFRLVRAIADAFRPHDVGAWVRVGDVVYHKPADGRAFGMRAAKGGC